MTREVMQDHYLIKTRKDARKFLWTSGLGDCLVIAATHNDKVLFAHLSSKIFLPVEKGGSPDGEVFHAVQAFLRHCRKNDIMVITNYLSPGNILLSAAIRLGFDLDCLRYAGKEGHVPITLEISTFQAYLGMPESVNDQNNLAGIKYTYPKKKPQSGFKSKCCVLF